MVITKAAIMYSNDEVVEGKDYSHIALLARKLGITDEKYRGFMTSSGEFVLPSDAARIAVESCQLRSAIIDELSPEDLWPTVVN